MGYATVSYFGTALVPTDQIRVRAFDQSVQPIEQLPHLRFAQSLLCGGAEGQHEYESYLRDQFPGLTADQCNAAVERFMRLAVVYHEGKSEFVLLGVVKGDFVELIDGAHRLAIYVADGRDAIEVKLTI